MTRVAIITGAAHGIGRAVARRLLNEGTLVVGVDKDLEALRANLPDARIHFATDVLDGAAFSAMLAQVNQDVGPPGILLNTVGASLHEKKLESITDEDWDRTFNLNVRSAFIGTRAVLPYMRQQRWGRIVCVSAVAGRTSTHFGGADFTAAKAALHGFVRQCAVELASSGITVNCVAPGLTLSERVEAAWTSRTDAERARLVAHIPIGRPSTVDEQAAPICFLFRDEAAYICGACLDVNGAMFVP